MVGIYLQRCIAILVILSIPIGIAWFFSSEVLQYFGSEKEVADIASWYLQALIPGVVPLLVFDATRRFLQGQGLFWPGMMVNAITTILHFVWCYIFIDIYGMHAAGAGLATSITYSLDLLLMIILIKYFKLCRDTWPGFMWD